jgi:hypothetical protein
VSPIRGGRRYRRRCNEFSERIDVSVAIENAGGAFGAVRVSRVSLDGTVLLMGTVATLPSIPDGEVAAV